MKLLSIFLVSVLGLSSAIADSALYTKEKNPKELATYQRAVLEEMRASNMSNLNPEDPKANEWKDKLYLIPCSFRSNNQAKDFNAWRVSVIIENADSVLVTDGIQPLLRFTTVEMFQTVQLTITTTSDYRKIIRAVVTSSHSKEVNTGTLKDPKFEYITIPETHKTCVIENKNQ